MQQAILLSAPEQRNHFNTFKGKKKTTRQIKLINHPICQGDFFQIMCFFKNGNLFLPLFYVPSRFLFFFFLLKEA